MQLRTPDERNEKNRERRARKHLRCEGCTLLKSHGRKRLTARVFTTKGGDVLHADDHGGYMIIHAELGVLAGERFDLSLTDVERFLLDEDEREEFDAQLAKKRAKDE